MIWGCGSMHSMRRNTNTKAYDLLTISTIFYDKDMFVTWGCAPTRRNTNTKAHDLLSSLTLYLR